MNYDAALELIVGLNLESLPWHEYELGFLQYKTPQQGDDAIDVHIWSPKIWKMPRGFNGVHDHRTLIRSTVVSGLIRDVRFEVEIGDDGDVDAWEIKHPEIRTEGDDNFRFIGRAGVTELGERVIQAGETYEVPRHTWHITRPPNGLSITVVEKRHGRGKAARTLANIPREAARAMSRAMAPSAPRPKIENMKVSKAGHEVLLDAKRVIDDLTS